MQTIRIEQGTRKKGRSNKGRSFEAQLLAYVEANSLWEGGLNGNDVRRPVWMMIAGTENQIRPFVANLMSGRKAEESRNSRSVDRYELMKSAGYQYFTQKTSAGVVVTAFLPDLFRLDPGMVDPKGVSFCMLPSEGWLPAPDQAAVKHLLDLGALPNRQLPGYGYHDPTIEDIIWIARMAPLFAAYLDRRTRCPLITDVRFYAQVLWASLREQLASKSPSSRYSDGWGVTRSMRYYEDGVTDVGLLPGLAFNAAHDNLEGFLAVEVQTYYQTIAKKVSHG